MNGPQLVILLLMVFELGGAVGRDGQPKEGVYSFWWTAVTWGVIAAILWAVGFWQ